MECSMCNESCNLPNDTKPSSKFAVILSDGKIVCNHCNDVLDWADSCGISKDKPLVKTKIKSIESSAQPKQSQTTTSNSQKEAKKTSSVMMISCPKCKSQFSGRVCSCGFKNPLFR